MQRRFDPSPTPSEPPRPSRFPGFAPGFDPDEVPRCNHSNNPAFAQILGGRLRRRQVLRGGLAAAVTVLFGPSRQGGGGPEVARAAIAPSATASNAQGMRLGFKGVPVSSADTFVVPEGYTARWFIPHGEPITGNFPAYGLDNSGADQGMQVGSHHDGMHFFPLNGSSTEGLLVLNHEYIEPRFLHRAAMGLPLQSGSVPLREDGRREPDQVLKEINAHGVTVVRVRRRGDGSWMVLRDRHNRRITGQTPMEIGGPVRGNEALKTRYSPDGTRTRGTLNNCAHGVTPWNTYLTCEENWARYFLNRSKGADGKPDLPREQRRYEMSTGEMSRYGWERAADGADGFVRFDVTPTGDRAIADYRNEANGFGWIVEINPFDPDSVPVKRTALGRFAHEGVVFQPAIEGQPVVCYSGDDSEFEYIYKYVSAEPYRQRTANGSLLDEGTLYVAKFNEDGTGEWLSLVFGQGALTAANGFRDQADVLLNTRAAADAVGATKMDRPEWGAVDPATGAVYFTLTNNADRTAEQVDAANPRPGNRTGQIIRWRERGDDPTAIAFEWDLFLLAGPPDNSRTLDGRSLDASNHFSSPDGLWFDALGRLWIQTDMSESVLNQGDHAQYGNNQMLVADPRSGEVRRFLTGPIGQEITGVVMTPDQRTMFVNVQHPGATTPGPEFAAGQVRSRWPEQVDSRYPRSATVIITKDDGGIIGT